MFKLQITVTVIIVCVYALVAQSQDTMINIPELNDRQISVFDLVGKPDTSSDLLIDLNNLKKERDKIKTMIMDTDFDLKRLNIIAGQTKFYDIYSNVLMWLPDLSTGYQGSFNGNDNGTQFVGNHRLLSFNLSYELNKNSFNPSKTAYNHKYFNAEKSKLIDDKYYKLLKALLSVQKTANLKGVSELNFDIQQKKFNLFNVSENSPYISKLTIKEIETELISADYDRQSDQLAYDESIIELQIYFNDARVGLNYYNPQNIYHLDEEKVRRIFAANFSEIPKYKGLLNLKESLSGERVTSLQLWFPDSIVFDCYLFGLNSTNQNKFSFSIKPSISVDIRYGLTGLLDNIKRAASKTADIEIEDIKIRDELRRDRISIEKYIQSRKLKFNMLQNQRDKLNILYEKYLLYELAYSKQIKTINDLIETQNKYRVTLRDYISTIYDIFSIDLEIGRLVGTPDMFIFSD